MKKPILLAVGMLASLSLPGFAQRPDGGPLFGGPGNMRSLLGGIAMGTIRQIDPAKSTIEVAMMGPAGQTRLVRISRETLMSRQAAGTLADLKPNDTVVLTGVPTAFVASQLRIGDAPMSPFGMAGPGLLGGGPPPPPGGAGIVPLPLGGPGVGRPPAAANGVPVPMPMAVQPAASVQVNGTVVTTDPLVVMLPGNVKMTVTADRSAQVTRIVKATLADLKVGETIMAVGQSDETGGLMAMRVNVGMDLLGGGGLFGFGGARGFFAPGGGGDGPRPVPVNPKTPF